MVKNFFDLQSLNGLKSVVKESMAFDRIIKEVYELTTKEVYGTVKTSGIAALAYGSPGRIELIGGDSDADIFLAENKRTNKSKKFKYLLKQRLENFNFSKIDMPNWGTYNEIDIYLEKSLVEGNQVLETRFLIGDSKVNKEIKNKKQRFDSVERGLKNIVFNRLYFNQYFRQRVRNGALNIKYCNGGSRDFLFVYWHDKLDRMMKGETEDIFYKPKIESGLERLFEQGKITEREFDDSIESVNFMTVLRADVLNLNKRTFDKGLTFLDEDTLQRLETIGYPNPRETINAFNRCRKSFDKIAKIIWKETINKAESLRGLEWGSQFRKAYDLKTSIKERVKISSDDSLMRIALIWEASESGQKELFDYLSQKHKDTEDWATIGSISCSPLCSPKILNHLGTGQAKEQGYGYLLRVIARNKNVHRDTLESIAYDSKLEKRYTEVAQASLEGGNSVANNQI